MIQHLLPIHRYPSKLIGTGLRMFGLNVLQHDVTSRCHRYATMIVLAESLHSEAAASVIVPRFTFTHPVAPLLNPDHALWDAHIAPHLGLAVDAMSTAHGGKRLGGILAEAARFTHQPGVLTGGGCLVLPNSPSPVSAVLHKRNCVKAAQQVGWNRLIEPCFYRIAA